jgi:hypothetical protein
MNPFLAEAGYISVRLMEDPLNERKGRDHAENETREFFHHALATICVPKYLWLGPGNQVSIFKLN